MPPASLLQAAAALAAQQPAARPDSLVYVDTLRGAALDSALFRRPLPGGVAAVSRFLFGLPQWVMGGAIVLGAIAGIALLVLLWRKRRASWAWFVSRSTAWKILYVTGAAIAVIAAASGGAVSWNYMQHNNDFCVSCHVMMPAFQRFRTSEHSKLSCHDCHRQSIFASSRQMYYWITERPMKIPDHAHVPTRICAECHVQRDPDSTWKQIYATAGHRLHLSSDSSALKGKVECVTCHGQEIHRFVPVNNTCGQSGCHDTDDTKIRLGKMASQTQLHCTGCHQFTRAIPATMTVDSAREAMTPGFNQCLSCHQMKVRLADFEPGRDPHRAACGTCHNPHTQTTPKAAFESCTKAGCHVGVDSLTPMHRGLPGHVLTSCGNCHEAHTWSVKATACVDCHKNMPATRMRTLRRSASATPPTPLPNELRLASVGSLAGLLSLVAPPTVIPASMPAEPRRPFSHTIHKDVACIACHANDKRHGETLVKSARDCATCHHRTDRATGCTGCHAGKEPAPAKAIPVKMTLAANAAPRERALTFSHVPHRDVACRDCHTTPVTLAVTRTCASCHDSHHGAARTCAACHTGDVKSAHTRSAHDGCATSGCHVSTTAATLAPTRNTCLVCHQAQTQHKPGRDCGECHRVTWTVAAARP